VGESASLWETLELRAAAGETLRPGGFALTDRAADMIGVVPGWRVLDVGSGLGATVERLRSRYGAEAWGVESSVTQIERAVDSASLVLARGDALPFGDQTFQAVFCECVLSLFDNPQNGIYEFCSVLKPGGYLVLADLHSIDSLTIGNGSCADRAVSLAETQAMVKKGGLTVRMVEDHSYHLRELAARLLMAGEKRYCSCDRSLGYYLMIAQKEGACHA
jgi:ubiquinone/menaquinone biosynthesis C-methylase UbiE